MSEHTSEPWRITNLTDIFSADRRGNVNDGFQIADCSVDYTSDADPGLTLEEMKANARRIVACVNAFAKYSIEDVEAHGANIVSAQFNFKQQCDELLVALKAIHDHPNCRHEVEAQIGGHLWDLLEAQS